ncbi:MAG: oligosaccharide flippase family protein [Deltaproteobacteria bacterium]|nr:oligosaccharide flippase family protein [Deltaproteobacteria bacterium]
MSLKKFVLHYSHFFTGSALSLMLGLVSFPIFTRILTREEYGIVGLLATTMFLAVAVGKAGLSDGIVRFYSKYSETEEDLELFSSTVLFRGVVLSTVVALLYLSIVFSIGVITGTEMKYRECYLIMTAYLWIRPLNIIVLNILRVKGKTVFYNVLNLVGRASAIIGSLTLMLYVFRSFYGYFVGLVAAELIVGILLFAWFFSTHKFNLSKVSWPLTSQLLKFGAPLLITEFSYLLLTYADRYLIVMFKGAADLGVYSVGYNLASYISDMIMFSLSYAVIPIYVAIFDKEGKEKTEEFLSKCAHYILIAIIPVFFGYMAISKNLFLLLASEKYVSAASFSPVILLGSLIIGMNNIFNAGLYLKKKSKLILGIMLFTLAINVALNILLLPEYGVLGSAVATLVSAIISSVATVYYSFKHIVVRISLYDLLYYTAASAIMYSVVTLSLFDLPTLWAGLLLQIFAGALIMIPFFAFKERELVAKIRSMSFLKGSSV